MAQILDQLHINGTLFYQFGLILLVHFLLSQIFFKPFLKLIEKRKEKTAKDRESARQLLAQAEQKMEFYKKTITAERERISKERAQALIELKAFEDQILTQARDQAKAGTQAAQAELKTLTADLQQKLQVEVQTIAKDLMKSVTAKGA